MAWYDAVGAFGDLATGIGQVGAAFGLGSSGDGRGAAKRALKQNTAIQQQQWQLAQRAYYRGVRDRVADATAAGLHPLFALGYQSPMPGVIGGMSGDFGGSAGGEDWAQFGAGLRSLSRAGRTAAGHRSRYDKAQVRIAEAEADMAEAAAVRAVDAANHTRPPMAPETVVQRNPEAKTHPLADYVTYEPVPVPARQSGNPSYSAGSKPAWQLVEVAPGIHASVPYTQEGTAEAVEGWGLPLTVLKNMWDFAGWANPVRHYYEWKTGRDIPYR